MKKVLLICFATFALGLSISTLIASPAPPPIEIGTWSIGDNSSGSGGPWSPQAVNLSMTNVGPDISIIVQPFGASGGAVGGPHSFAYPIGGGTGTLNLTVPPGGTVLVTDLNDPDYLGASGEYVVQ